jgi:hypothetical protein
VYGERSGCTSPCSAQRQPLAQGLGSVNAPPQRGQMGAVFMDTDVDRCERARQALRGMTPHLPAIPRHGGGSA